jgi:hypothetical protein
MENLGTSEWRVPAIMTGVGGMILLLSFVLFVWNMIASAFFQKVEADVEMPVAENAGAEVIPVWLNNWKPWLVGTVALIVVAYAPMLVQLLREIAATSPGFNVWQ